MPGSNELMQSPDLLCWPCILGSLCALGGCPLLWLQVMLACGSRFIASIACRLTCQWTENSWGPLCKQILLKIKWSFRSLYYWGKFYIKIHVKWSLAYCLLWWIIKNVIAMSMTPPRWDAAGSWNLCFGSMPWLLMTCYWSSTNWFQLWAVHVC